MNKSKLTAVIGVTVLTASLGVATVFAGDFAKDSQDLFGARIKRMQNVELTDEQKAAMKENGFVRGRASEQAEQLTDEQKAEREALKQQRQAEMEAKKQEFADKMAARKEKIEALTDEQKDELYALKEKANSAQVEMIDKYLELGLIDQQVAEEMKTKMADGLSQMKENGQIPVFMAGNGGIGFRDGGRSFKKADGDVQKEREQKLTVREPMTEEQRAEMKAALEAKLAEAVESGRLTQEEADKILERHLNADQEIMRVRGRMSEKGFNRVKLSEEVPAEEVLAE